LISLPAAEYGRAGGSGGGANVQVFNFIPIYLLQEFVGVRN